jgi:hypothetical protein
MNNADQSRRLLLGSKLVNQFKRVLQLNIDLTRLLGDESFSRDLIQTIRGGYADGTLATLMDEFEQISIKSGAWQASSESAPSNKYMPNAQGLIPAAAAWDPDYTPPPTNRPAAPSAIELEPSVSPRVQVVADKQRFSSGFFSRFGLTKPPPSPSTSSGFNQKSSNLPEPEAPSDPVDPKLKKYIRGAR